MTEKSKDLRRRVEFFLESSPYGPTAEREWKNLVLGLLVEILEYLVWGRKAE